MLAVFLFSGVGGAMALTLESLPDGAAELVYTPRGTGQTTGHIATLEIYNPTGRTVVFELPMLYIPATGKYQGYLVSDPTPVKIEPGERIMQPVYGYCTDIHRPPVPLDEPMTPLATWIGPDDLPYRPEPGQVPVELPGIGLRSDLGAAPLLLTYPGTGVPFPYTVDPNSHPELAAPMLLAVFPALQESYDRLKAEGKITTPFSGHPDREREAVLQQTFWIASGALAGKDYTKEQFQERMESQMEERSGRPIATLPPEQKEQLDQGVNNFWDSFELVGAEAKILKKGEPGMAALGGACRMICPENASWADQDYAVFRWACDASVTGPYDLKIFPEGGEPITVEGIAGTEYGLDRPLAEGTGYRATVAYTVAGGTGQAVPIAFSTNPGCMAELQETIKKLAELWEAVKNARDELHDNPLVNEVETIEAIRSILETPEGVLTLFDQWLGDKMPLVELATAENPQDLANKICADLPKIKGALEYAKKVMNFLHVKGGQNPGNLPSKLDSVIAKLEGACENQEKFDQFYAELRSSVSDLRGYLAGKMSDYLQAKMQKTLERLLANKLGQRAAGSIMSAAMDSWNFIDALIKKGNLEEAKKLYYLMYFRMLEQAYACSRYHIDATWNSETNGLPQIDWANCKEVLGKTVVLEAYVKCWKRKAGGAPNEGEWETKQIKFQGNTQQLTRRNFQPDECGKCKFQFQLDLADLAAQAAGCEHAYVEIRATVNGTPVPIFSGVYKP